MSEEDIEEFMSEGERIFKEIDLDKLKGSNKSKNKARLAKKEKALDYMFDILD